MSQPVIRPAHTFEVTFIRHYAEPREWEYVKLTVNASSPNSAAHEAVWQEQHKPWEAGARINWHFTAISWRELIDGKFSPMDQQGQGCRSGIYLPCAADWKGEE